jgi:hypothetical protein
VALRKKLDRVLIGGSETEANDMKNFFLRGFLALFGVLLAFTLVEIAFRGMRPEQLTIHPSSDPHPNELAHRIFSEHLYAYLHAKGFLPEDLKMQRVFHNLTFHRRFPHILQKLASDLEKPASRASFAGHRIVKKEQQGSTFQ